jgi:hypothetical protein
MSLFIYTLLGLLLISAELTTRVTSSSSVLQLPQQSTSSSASSNSQCLRNSSAVDLYWINLETSLDRRRFMLQQLQFYGWWAFNDGVFRLFLLCLELLFALKRFTKRLRSRSHAIADRLQSNWKVIAILSQIDCIALIHTQKVKPRVLQAFSSSFFRFCRNRRSFRILNSFRRSIYVQNRIEISLRPIVMFA